MKVKLKPWQIGLIAAAGVVVLGGAGTGIYFGVNHAIDDAVNEKLNAALETTTDATTEPALDEPSTVIPTQPTTESSTEKECSTAPQITKQSDIVTKSDETNPAVEQTDWTFDEELSKEVFNKISDLRVSKGVSQIVFDSTAFDQAKTRIKEDLYLKENYATPTFVIIKSDTITADELCNYWFQNTNTVFLTHSKSGAVVVGKRYDGYYGAYFFSND